MIKFRGKDLEQEFGLTALGRGTYGAPERDIEQIHVPGRNGDLLYDNGGFKNISVTYPCSITENQPENSFALRNFLLASPGYHRLENDYDTDHYRLAEYRGPFEPDVFTERENGAANFDLVFNAKPQRFRKADADYMGAPIINGNTMQLYLGRYFVGEEVEVKLTFTHFPSTFTFQGASSLGGGLSDVSGQCVIDRTKKTITYTGTHRYIEFSGEAVQYVDITGAGITRRYRNGSDFNSWGEYLFGTGVVNTGSFPAIPDLRILAAGTLTKGDKITLSYYTSRSDVQTITITFGNTVKGGGQIDILGESAAVVLEDFPTSVTYEISGALKAIPAGVAAVILISATTAQDVRLGLEVNPNAWDI